jgi:hypothetical protein
MHKEESMQTHEVQTLSEVLTVAAMTIRLDDREQRPSVDPELLKRELETEDWFLMTNTSLD